MVVVNLAEKMNLIDAYWSPKIIGELNGQQVKMAKLKGEFIWHKHDNEDELFMVLKGTLKIAFRDREAILRENEMIIIPRGVEHKPVAEEEVYILLFEPASTLNTGDVHHTLTMPELDWI